MNCFQVRHKQVTVFFVLQSSCMLFVTFAAILLSLVISSKHGFFIYIISNLLSGNLQAQDTLFAMPADPEKEKIHSPKVAGIASAILPGAGQAYNKKYWKVPIVYAGLATAGYFIYYNANVYNTVKKNLDSRVAGDTMPSPQYLYLNNIFSKTTVDLNSFEYNDLILIEDEYRKYLTISILIGSLIYTLNIVDAVVDAHLFSFDVGNNLSMNVVPQLYQSTNYKPVAGVGLTLSFK